MANFHTTTIGKLFYVCLLILFSLNVTYAQEDTECILFVRPVQPPKFPGGNKAMLDFITKNLKYPEGLEEHIGGRVILKLEVKKDGSIGEIKALRTPHKALTKEVIRVVRLFPRFEPGKQNGVPVKMWILLPVWVCLQ